MIKFIRSKCRSEKGFTLIELLIVIVVLSILALVAAPRLMSLTDKAREQVDMANAVNVFKDVQVAVMMGKIDLNIVAETDITESVKAADVEVGDPISSDSDYVITATPTNGGDKFYTIVIKLDGEVLYSGTAQTVLNE